MRYLHPAALTDLGAMRDALVLSDMARSPAAQLLARQTRKGSQTVAEGGHVKLLCIDLDVDETMKRGAFGHKWDLDREMAIHHWYCHRYPLKGRRGSEDWHYNWIPEFGRWYRESENKRRTNDAMQLFADSLYGHAYTFGPMTVQVRLGELRLYDGDIDGKHGPLTCQAVRMFQRTYRLKVDGIAGPVTQKTLAIATCTYSDGEH